MPKIEHINNDIYNSNELPELKLTGNIEGRKVFHIPASHKYGALKSKASIIGNCVVCTAWVGLVIAGGIMNGVMVDACNNDKPNCNPTLETAGKWMWISGLITFGVQCCVMSTAVCCIKASDTCLGFMGGNK